MSTTNLSQRLRELKAMCITHGERHSIPNETAHWLMVGAVDELEKAIAQAEAQEGRAYFEARVKPSSDGPVVAHLSMDPNASLETIEAVKDLVQKAYSYKPSQAIGERTPVAKPNDWSNPEFRAKTFLERMRRLRADVSMWQGKCSVLRHENNRLRAKPSPEARDIAIEALATVIELWRDELVNEGYDTSTNFDKATQSLSALRGQ